MRPIGIGMKYIYIHILYYLLCCCLLISILHIGAVYRFIFLFAASASSNQAGFGFFSRWGRYSLIRTVWRDYWIKNALEKIQLNSPPLFTSLISTTVHVILWFLVQNFKKVRQVRHDTEFVASAVGRWLWRNWRLWLPRP